MSRELGHRRRSSDSTSIAIDDCTVTSTAQTSLVEEADAANAEPIPSRRIATQMGQTCCRPDLEMAIGTATACAFLRAPAAIPVSFDNGEDGGLDALSFLHSPSGESITKGRDRSQLTGESTRCRNSIGAPDGIRSKDEDFDAVSRHAVVLPRKPGLHLSETDTDADSVIDFRLTFTNGVAAHDEYSGGWREKPGSRDHYRLGKRCPWRSTRMVTVALISDILGFPNGSAANLYLTRPQEWARRKRVTSRSPTRRASNARQR